MLGLSDGLVRQIHGDNRFYQLAHAELRCFRCELAFRSSY
jgi:hypothetical protein